MNKDIKIEVLYGEAANLFGELQNIHYLQECIPGCTVIQTGLWDEPAFVRERVHLVYMGAMTESQQELAINALRPYKDAINARIDEGVVFLMTGNAMEVMEAYIENDDGSRIEGLGIFNTYAKRDMMHRYNSLVLGKFQDIKVVGFKAQFSHSYGSNEQSYFYTVIRGDGLHPGTQLEGLRKNNFFGTYAVGPFLILNPLFVKYLLGLMGAEPVNLYCEDVIMAAYEQRLREFEDEKLRYK